MTNINSKQTKQTEKEPMDEVTSPIDIVKSPIEDALMPYKNKLLKLNYMSECFIKLDDSYLKPIQSKFLIEKYNRIFSIKYSNNSLAASLAANFTVFDARTIKYISNDKSMVRDEEYYVLDLINCNGIIVKDIAIQKMAKFDMNKFQEALSIYGNHFQMNFNLAGFKTFTQDYIFPKLQKTVLIYKNSGLIEPQKFLFGNALTDKGEISWADENGLIKTSDENTFVKADDNTGYPLPILYKSEKSGKAVAHALLKNYCECWGNNTALALLAIGHMAMGLFYQTFIKKIGTPILIVGGATGTGKSTIVQNGVAIFGFDENFVNAGDSTASGQEGVAQAFNGVNICIDDLLDKILESVKFGATIKKLFKSSTRVRRKGFGQLPDFTKPCSQAVYSTNGALPDIPELSNRANAINIMTFTLDVEKFQYFEENIQNRAELSLILPELLKFSEKEVISIHNQLQEYLKKSVGNDVIPRIFHNIAYMWTGITLLEKIADYKIENLHLGVIEYSKKVTKHYNELPTPVDMLLNGLLALKNHEMINDTCHYKIKEPQHTEDGRIHLIFHKDTLLTAYNKFFAGDENRKIKTNVFNNYLSIDKRVIRTDFTARYDGTGKNSVVLDITDWAEAAEFTGIKIKPMSADEFRARFQERNNM